MQKRKTKLFYLHAINGSYAGIEMDGSQIINDGFQRFPKSIAFALRIVYLLEVSHSAWKHLDSFIKLGIIFGCQICKVYSISIFHVIDV